MQIMQAIKIAGSLDKPLPTHVYFQWPFFNYNNGRINTIDVNVSKNVEFRKKERKSCA